MADSVCQLFNLLDVAHRARDGMNRALEPFELTEATFGLLYRLQKGSQTNKALAEAASCAPSNITRLMDRLQELGLVERQPAPGDRRRLHATLTPEGERRYAAAVAALQDTQAALLARVVELADG